MKEDKAHVQRKCDVVTYGHGLPDGRPARRGPEQSLAAGALSPQRPVLSTRRRAPNTRPLFPSNPDQPTRSALSLNMSRG